MSNEQASEQEEGSILSIIQSVKDGVLDAKMIDKDTRQRCVEFLISEGYAEAQIAQILMRNEKTIRRDLSDIRARNAMSPDLNLAKQIVGDLYQKGMAHHKYLMRLARSAEASPGEKCQSEFLAWRVLKEVIEKMQMLGYLPLKPQEIVEDVFFHAKDTENERSLLEAKAVLMDIENAAKTAGTLDPVSEEKIKSLKAKIERAEINHEVDKIAQNENKPNEETHNGK